MRVTNLFYRHRLIRNLSEKDRDPSYIPAETFAGVAMDLALTYQPASGVEPCTGRE